MIKRRFIFGLAALSLLALAGCTAMMMGGGAKYEPPADECREGDTRKDCRS